MSYSPRQTPWRADSDGVFRRENLLNIIFGHGMVNRLINEYPRVLGYSRFLTFRLLEELEVGSRVKRD